MGAGTRARIMKLDFNPLNHEFRMDGKIIPSVTQVLKAAGLIDAQPHGDSWYANRGTAVHEATVLHDENDLDETTLDPEIVPYLEAWKKFRAEMNFELVEKPELQVYSELGYAGIVDRVCKINGQISILDIKTGVFAKWWSVQLAAYAMAYENHVDAALRAAKRTTVAYSKYTYRRYAVQITNEGTYKMTEYTDRNDFLVFTSALTVANWRQANG